MKHRSLASRAVRPLIGVTTSEVRRAPTVKPTPHGEPPRVEMALGLTYLQAIERAGGIPMVIPPMHEEAIEPLLDRLDGICLSGGPDIHPSVYGEAEDPQLGPTEPSLDHFELALARRTDARDMPLIAICRGMQNLNVARGGTLFQHLGNIDGTLEHRQETLGDQPSHSVEIESGTLLARSLDATEAEVNSFHHQAVDALGKGLVITARSPDGVVEGIEATDREFCLGVQWHAELLVERESEQLALFRAFCEQSVKQRAESLGREVA